MSAILIFVVLVVVAAAVLLVEAGVGIVRALLNAAHDVFRRLF